MECELQNIRQNIPCRFLVLIYSASCPICQWRADHAVGDASQGKFSGNGTPDEGNQGWFDATGNIRALS